MAYRENINKFNINIGIDTLKISFFSIINILFVLILSGFAAASSINVTTDPAASNVYLNNSFQGVSDLSGFFQISDLSQGYYSLIVNRTNYTTESSELNLLNNTNVSIAFTLTLSIIQEPEAQSVQNGSIILTTTPGSANAYLNGTLKTTTNPGGGGKIPDIVPGFYNLKVNKTGYTTDTRNIQIDEGENESVTVALASIAPDVPGVVQNGSIILTTTPGSANAYLNGTLKTTTNPGGGGKIPDIVPGFYNLKINKTDYTTDTRNIQIDEGENESVTVALTSTIPEPEYPVVVTENSTSLTPLGFVFNGATYSMNDFSNATFFVRLNKTDSISWMLNGDVMFSNSTNSSSFKFNPGVMWLPDPNNFSKTIANVTVLTSGQSASWVIHVVDALNPFFKNVDGSDDSVGSQDTAVHVLTNNDAVSFSNLNVTIWNGHAKRFFYHQLSPLADGGNTDWRFNITNIAEGLNDLFYISGFDTKSNSEIFVALPAGSRTHWRDFKPPPKNRDAEGPEGSVKPSSGGGGSTLTLDALAKLRKPQLVYVTMEKDVLALDEKNKIKLDAKFYDSEGGVKSIEGQIIPPVGKTLYLKFNLVKGSHNYGTWESEIIGQFSGKYEIYSITMIANDTNIDPVKELVHERSFYVVSEASVSEGEQLGLVYTLLNQSNVKNGTDIQISIDARDSKGITNATAYVESNRQSLNLIIPLKLVKGSSTYGTWVGSFTTEIPDSTYQLVGIELSNGGNSTLLHVSERSVYVKQLPKDSNQINPLIGNVVASNALFSEEWVKEMLNEPLIPTTLAFSLMGTIMIFAYLGPKINKQFAKLKHNK
jgi:hypothetical protein